MPGGGAVENTLKLVGEGLIPGASQLVDGNVKSGLTHALAGVAAGAVLGPIGLLLVKANSFSTSVSNKSLYGHASETISRKPSGSE